MLRQFPHIEVPNSIESTGKVLTAADSGISWDNQSLYKIAGINTRNVGSISFSNIPQTFTHLKIIGFVAPDTGGNTLQMTINGVTAVSSAYIQHNGTTTWVGATSSSNGFIAGYTHANGTSVEVTIPNYKTLTRKTYHSICGMASGNNGIGFGSGNFTQTSPINTITITQTSSNAIWNFSLYGMM